MATDVKDKLVTVEGLGVTLGKDKSGNDVESTYTKKDFSSLAVAPTPYNGNEIIPLRYGNTNYGTTVNELLSAAGGGGGSSQGALVNYVKNCGTISSLPQTINDANITSDMVVLEAVLGTPSAQTDDWSVSTANGSVTISGSITGSTTLMLYFGVGMTTAPSLMTNLASTSTDNILKAAPRPGVMGTLGLANGGTGKSASSEADLRSKLGITPTNIGAVDKAGDTMTGDLVVEHPGDTSVVAKCKIDNIITPLSVYLNANPGGKHGLWSDGYFDGANVVTGQAVQKYLIYRDKGGKVHVADHYAKDEIDAKIESNTFTGNADANDYTKFGFYHVGITSNGPYAEVTYGMLLVFTGGSGFVAQILISTDMQVFYRYRNNTTSNWLNWRVVTATSV